MNNRTKVRHEFVEYIPKEREDGVVYVSIPYATVVHNCLCGCGLKVVTPISPVGWQITFDGESITLAPSIGNWGFPCRSHYFIRHDTIVWANDMSEESIGWGRSQDRAARDTYFGVPPAPPMQSSDLVKTISEAHPVPHKKQSKAKRWQPRVDEEGVSSVSENRRGSRLSAEGRKRISEAMKRIWAERRKASNKL